MPDETTTVDQEMNADSGADQAHDQPGDNEQNKGVAPSRDGWAPVARVKELVIERNEAEARAKSKDEEIVWLRHQLIQSPPEKDGSGVSGQQSVDVEPLYEELQSAIDEGRGSDAARVQRKIFAAERAEMEASVEQRFAATTSEVSQQVSAQQGEVTFQRALKATLNAHPEFDKDSVEYDSAKTQKVMKLMRGFHAAGDDKVTAMETAIEMVGGAAQDQGLSFEDRATDQRRANAAQSREQAPKMTTSSNRTHTDGKIDVSKMTWEQFKEFRKDKAAYSAARGDNL